MSNKAQAAVQNSTNSAPEKELTIKRQGGKSGDARRMLEDRIAEERLSREIQDFQFDF